ncbi:MAG TPA: glutaredoxin domain-containing protein [Candidatus Paceibacterota bacterium]
MKEVRIYSTPSCMYCRAAKEFFKKNNVAYTDYDVSTDAQRRQEMIDKSGQMGVPVIFVGDEMVVGFDEGKLFELVTS